MLHSKYRHTTYRCFYNETYFGIILGSVRPGLTESFTCSLSTRSAIFFTPPSNRAVTRILKDSASPC